eukprot:gene30777-40074_t
MDSINKLRAKMGFLLNNLTFVTFLIILANSITVYFVFSYNVSTVSTLDDTELYRAFGDPTYIYFGLTINIATSIPTIVDLILDFQYYRDSPEDEGSDAEDPNYSWVEKLSLATLNIVTGSVVLLLRARENLPYIYACVHAVQFVGSIGMVLLICQRLIPAFFNTKDILGTLFFFSAASVTSMLGFGHDISFWPNIVTFFLIATFFYFLIGRMCFPWLKDLRARVVNGKDTLTTKELCSLWYFMSSVIIIIFVPGVVATLKLYDWSRFDIWDVYVFVYTFAIYGIIISTIPGRLAKFAVEKGRKKLVQSKRALIRYMSHEVRSPLNVICSGLNLLWVDITKLSPFKEKAGLLETLTSIRQASADVIQTTNDLLQLEKMDSDAFSIVEKIVPCSDLTKIAESCDVVAREKGILFSVNNQFASEQAETKLDDTCDAVEDIETGQADMQVRQPDRATAISIDEHKFGQVIRNLISNSAKFTPEGRAIAVNIRRSNEADLAAELADKDAPVPSKTSITTPNNEVEYLFAGNVTIEIADTGVGIAPENWDKVFGQFAQFDANKLQGGGGSGLGLWICQQIIKLHGSKIRFHSDGEDLRLIRHVLADIFAPPVFSSGKNLSSVSPEPFPLIPVPPAAGNAMVGGPFPPSRQLSHPGVCKVLVVDDSRTNVKIMIRLVNQISGDCFHRMGRNNRATSRIGGCDTNITSIIGSRKQSVVGRGKSYHYSRGDRGYSSEEEEEEEEDEDESEVGVEVMYGEADDGQVAVKMVQEAAKAAQLMRAGGFKGLIVGVTGNVMAEDRDKYIQSGADYVLGKPVKVNELQQILLQFN